MEAVHPKVDEAIETLNMKDGPTRRRLLKGTGLVSATGRGLGAARGVQFFVLGRHHAGEECDW